MLRDTPRRAAGLFILCLSTTTPAAEADEPKEPSAADKARASELYAQAMKRFDEDDLEPALAGFKESYEHVKSPNSHFMVARTLARLGRNVEAYLELETVAAEADTMGSRYAQTATEARAKQEEVRGRVGLVVVTLEGAPKGTTVKVGEDTLAPHHLGKPYPVLPGETRIVTTAPDGRHDSRVITLAAGKSTHFDARIPEASPAEPTQVAEISHRRYWLDASVHGGGETIGTSDAVTRGAGVGGRVATELLHGGLIRGLDDNLAFGLGATWIGTSTDPHTWLEGSLEWGFWLTPELRLAPEPGVGVSLGSGTHVRPIARLDASYRVWDDLHVVARLGVPVTTLGVAYVK